MQIYGFDRKEQILSAIYEINAKNNDNYTHNLDPINNFIVH